MSAADHNSLQVARAALLEVTDSWYALRPEQIRELLEQIRTAPPPAPSIAGLFYRGQTHGLPGKRDAGKSLFMALVARDILNAGGRVLWIDHEQGARRVLRRLVDFGTDDEAMAERFFLILDPMGLTPAGVIEAYADAPPDLAVIDAMTGQMASSGLNDNHAVDVDLVYATLCKPLARDLRAAVVIIDHVPHGDGDRPLGSQRKSSAPDVELIFKAIGKFKPGLGGRAKIIVGRDRDGAVRPCEFILEPDYSWRLEASGDGDWLPTTLMLKVSEYLEAQTQPVSKATVERDVHGSAEHKRQAIDELIKRGHVATSSGPRNAILLVSVSPYRPPESTSSDLVVTSSGRGTSPPRHLVSPYKGDEDEGEVDWLEHLVASENGYYDEARP